MGRNEKKNNFFWPFCVSAARNNVGTVFWFDLRLCLMMMVMVMPGSQSCECLSVWSCSQSSADHRHQHGLKSGCETQTAVSID